MQRTTMSRRGLLAAAPAAALGALAPRVADAAPSVPPLPSAFPADVFRERQERLGAELKKAGLDAAIVVPSTNLQYVANLDTHRSERLMALVVRPGARSVFISPAFEEDRVRRDAVAADIVTWREEEDPIKLLARTLKGAATVGIEGSTDFHTVARLAETAGVKTPDASGVFDALRTVKSEKERALIADAAARTERAIAATHAQLREGMTERQIAEILEKEFRNQLVRGGGLVQIGTSSALPHGGPGDASLKRGSVILIDCGCRVNGYSSDITRTAFFGGTPPDKVRKVYATVDAAHRAALAAFRAGAIPEQVDRAARSVIEQAGWAAAFTHRVGHGLGMDGHEAPYLVGGNRKPLVAGNVCTIEPGIYLRGEFGVRIEDDYAAKDGGAEPLSHRPKEMPVLGS